MTDTEMLYRVALGYAKRSWRVLHAVITVTKRHVPKWIAGLLTVCLFIPGPLDEILVFTFVCWFAWRRPAMRRDLASATRNAWMLDIEQPEA